ncbi:MAG: YggS family pyridoxal phosphate-dependent enzyme [Lachnoclostridium sp.]|nr:YggS family pyridoxal phosphate-dependent enzyme [Lachnoclostridium sp.]
MSLVADNLKRVAASVPDGVVLVAVSKFHPAPRLMDAYVAGQRVFAESRAAELVEKASTLPADISWHFIGHLQTNKVRRILPYVSLIQSVDSPRLLELIDSESRRIGRVTDILLEVTEGGDETKSGFRPDDFEAFISGWRPADSPGVRVRGLMGMASLTDDEAVIRSEFTALRSLFDRVRSTVMAEADYFDTLSMGMSDDRDIAISCGSTMVRVGTDIFGHREY